MRSFSNIAFATVAVVCLLALGACNHHLYHYEYDTPAQIATDNGTNMTFINSDVTINEAPKASATPAHHSRHRSHLICAS